MQIKRLNRIGVGETTIGTVQTVFGFIAKEPIKTQREDTAMLTASHRQPEDWTLS